MYISSCTCSDRSAERISFLRCTDSHENSRNPWPNCVPCPWAFSRWLHRPWFATRFNLQTEHGVSCLSDGCAGPLARQCQYPRRPNVPASSCISRPYSFTVWFSPDGDSFPTFLFPRFRRGSSSSSYFSSSSPSSFLLRRSRPGREFIIARIGDRNFFAREFYRPKFIFGRGRRTDRGDIRSTSARDPLLIFCNHRGVAFIRASELTTVFIKEASSFLEEKSLRSFLASLARNDYRIFEILAVALFLFVYY